MNLLQDSTNVNNLCTDLSNLVIHSKTSSTWAKHISAWKLYDIFILETNQDSWNMDIFKARQFVVWALNTRKLKPDTVKTYLYSIKLAHVLKNVQCDSFSKDDIFLHALAHRHGGFIIAYSVNIIAKYYIITDNYVNQQPEYIT